MEQERILIVEDERIIALDLKRRLERFGYTVVGMASDAESGIEMTTETLPDLVLMDIMLQNGSDGVEAATIIREKHRIPVVFLTAYADDTTIQRAKRAEPVGYVLKPFKERELLTTIDIGLYKSRVERELLRQERLFSSILRSAGDGIIATDAEGCIKFMNPVAETLTGWREDEAVGQNVNQVAAVVSEATNETVLIPTGESGADSLGSPQGARVFEGVAIRNKVGATIHIEGTVTEIRSERDEFEGLTIAFHDITDIKRLNETVSYQASHDALTWLINRDEFAARLEPIARETEKSDRSHTFLFVDIDQFKVINDVCGHRAGDELLTQTADEIERAVTPDHILARMGGDQFGVILKDTDITEGEQIARSVVDTLNRRFVWEQKTFNVTASVGAAPISSGNSSVNDILAAGDDAMALAKEHGGNGVRVYTTSDFVFLRRKGEMQWIARLTQALEEDRFALFHQEIEPLSGGSDPWKYEILLRLRDNKGGLVSPGEFIAAAERYKLMPSIDKWVVAAACRYVAQAAQAGIELPVICVNLSGSSIADDTLLDYILRMFEEHQVDGSSFCLEITETSAIQNFHRAVAFIDRLRETGATFALDDFGNGFSSFSYLKQLRVDYLKIDGSFVKDVETDDIDFAMVQAVNNIGHIMGMKTIAEYVRNDTIRDMMRDIGVDYAQGYAVSRPEPLPHAESLLNNPVRTGT
jgi:diguanylate cyclase (GGDEF)-like protein/PAS domain S-box-containing protein